MKAHKQYNYAGRYIRLGLQVSPAAIRAVEFLLRIDESMVRFLTIKEPAVAPRHGSEQPREYARIDPFTSISSTPVESLDFVAQNLLVSLNLVNRAEIESLPTYRPPTGQAILPDDLCSTEELNSDTEIESDESKEPQSEADTDKISTEHVEPVTLTPPVTAGPTDAQTREARLSTIRRRSEADNLLDARLMFTDDAPLGPAVGFDLEWSKGRTDSEGRIDSDDPDSDDPEFVESQLINNSQFTRSSDHKTIQAELDKITQSKPPK